MEIVEIKELTFDRYHSRFYFHVADFTLKLLKSYYIKHGKKALKNKIKTDVSTFIDIGESISCAAEFVIYFTDKNGEVRDEGYGKIVENKFQ